MKSQWDLLKLLGEISWTFMKMSPMTFGGGYAMLPIIERVVVEERSWVSEEEMTDMISVSSSAPGGIGVNMSAYIGYRVAGVRGAIAAVLGITIPTFLIVLIASVVLFQFQYHPKVEAALKGIHGAIIALIGYAAYQMGKKALFDFTTWLLLAVTLVLLLTSHIHPFFILVGGIFAGIAGVAIKKIRGLPIRMEKDAAQVTGSASPGSFKYSDYYMAEGI